MAELSAEDFTAAVARGEARLRGPCAEAVHYDQERDRVIIRLKSGIELGLRPQDVEGLAGASVAQLSAAVVEAQGTGIHFPQLDVDLYLPALLEGVLGSRQWMASRMGAAGGKVRSSVKSAAARANGKKGGRPRGASAA